MQHPSGRSYSVGFLVMFIFVLPPNASLERAPFEFIRTRCPQTRLTDLPYRRSARRFTIEHPDITMPAALVTHTAKVNAPASVMWKLLVEKVRKPHKFIPGLEEKNVEVIQDIAPLCIERRMTFENDVIHEIITADEATQTVRWRADLLMLTVAWGLRVQLSASTANAAASVLTAKFIMRLH